MGTQIWTQRPYTRRSFVRGIGMAAGALALAPAIAACRGSAKRGSASSAAGSAARPVRGGTLTSCLPGDVTTLDYASTINLLNEAIIGNCVEPLLTLDTQG